VCFKFSIAAAFFYIVFVYEVYMMPQKTEQIVKFIFTQMLEKKQSQGQIFIKCIFAAVFE